MEVDMKENLSHVPGIEKPFSRFMGICVLACAVCLSACANAEVLRDELPDTSVTVDSSPDEFRHPEAEDVQSAPTDPCPSAPVNMAFRAGEWFHFSIQYGFVKAGDALMQVQGIEEIDGHPCYHLVSKAESSGFFSLFFKVRDRVDSFMDKKMLVSRRFSKKTHEGKHRAHMSVDFDHSSGVARYSDGTEVELPVCSQDILSAFYYVRTLRLNVGQRVQVPCHADKKNYPLEVIVHRRESVRTPAGRFDCLVVEPVLKTTGIFEQKGRLTIWLTDDEYKVPVIMKSKVAVGSISAILTDMHVVKVGGEYARTAEEQAPRSRE